MQGFLGRWPSGRLWKCPQELPFRETRQENKAFACLEGNYEPGSYPRNCYRSSTFSHPTSSIRTLHTDLELYRANYRGLLSQKYRTCISCKRAQCLSKVDRRQPGRIFSPSNMSIEMFLYKILLFSFFKNLNICIQKLQIKYLWQITKLERHMYRFLH